MSPRASAAVAPAEVARVFAALGEPTRLRIVSRLCADGPLTATRLSEGAPVTRQAVEKHLRTLEAAGVVRGVREGRERLWVLQLARVTEARRALDRISAQWDAALGRLRNFVEQ